MKDLITRRTIMACIQLHPIFQQIDKSIGDLSFYHVNGKTHIRRKVAAANPRSAAQQRNRASFHGAVRAWQGLSADEKQIWNARAQTQRRKGYHLFISEHMTAQTKGRLTTFRFTGLNNKSVFETINRLKADSEGTA